MRKATLRLTYTGCVIIAMTILLYLPSCKKEEKQKIYQIQGRLLISNSNPMPVANYTIDFFQAGTPSIPFPAYAISSSASTETDANGFFKCDFRLGKSSFLFLNGTNSGPVRMEGRSNASFPYFSFANIPLTDLGNVFLYKKIDTAIIEVVSINGILPTDTLEIYYYTFNGFRQKIKSGVTVPAGSGNKVIDTLFNVITSNYSYAEKKYGSPVTVRQTKNFNLLNQYMSAISIEPGDEKKRTFLLY